MADIIALLGALIKVVPGLVDLISALIEGDPDTIERVREILPRKSASESALEELLKEYPSD